MAGSPFMVLKLFQETCKRALKGAALGGGNDAMGASVRRGPAERHDAVGDRSGCPAATSGIVVARIPTTGRFPTWSAFALGGRRRSRRRNPLTCPGHRRQKCSWRARLQCRRGCSGARARSAGSAMACGRADRPRGVSERALGGDERARGVSGRRPVEDRFESYPRRVVAGAIRAAEPEPREVAGASSNLHGSRCRYEGVVYTFVQ
jgi:hypothetical protein